MIFSIGLLFHSYLFGWEKKVYKNIKDMQVCLLMMTIGVLCFVLVVTCNSSTLLPCTSKGSHEDILFALMTYGIRPESIPVDSMGNTVFDEHLQWIEDLRAAGR
mmetsp:Transcript_18212/g.25275  ORF Transcript_18212/g.25275 Transcript_18212/m.25275 type:complete len:104 (-) Transcript_18212:347-658(-)